MFGKPSYQNPIFSFSLTIYKVCIGVSTLPQKHTTPSFLATTSPSLNQQTFQAPPLFRQSEGDFVSPPLKVRFFSLNTIYLLKVTRFLGKIPQFEFLVMAEKNIFACKLFLSLNISDFTLFFMWKLHPPWKKSPPLKVEIFKPSLLFENLIGSWPPCPPCRKGELHTMNV